MDALTPDDTNVIAIECTNKGGGQYIDFGLTGIRPIPTGIKDVKSEKLKAMNESGNKGTYNLLGQIVNSKSSNGKLKKGINIVNGKKILY